MNKKLITIIIFTIGLLYTCYSFYTLYISKDKLKELKEQYETMEVAEIDSTYEENKNKLDNLLNKDNYDNEEIEEYITDLTNKKSTIESSNNSLLVEGEELDKEINELNEEYKVIYNNYINANTYKIDDVINISQFPNYPTGCESVSLYILLKYYNVDVSIDDIINTLRKGDLPYLEGGTYYGGNPYLEFVGDPRNSASFGTYESAIIEVANQYKPGIINGVGTSLSDVLNLVKQNRPVMVWVSINMALPYISANWIYKPTNETIYWQANEHAVVVIGYTANSIIASDPYTGIIKYYNRTTFENRYNYFGKRAIYY